MQLWQDGLVAMLAAIGLASLMWMVVRALFFAQPERRQGVVALITAQGDGDALEQQVHTLECMRREQGVLGMILLVDCGLTDEGQRVSRLLAREDRWVALCQMEEIGRYLSGA